MRKNIFALIGLMLTSGLILPNGFIKEASAGHASIDIHIPLPPPPRIFINPPEIVVLPGAPVFVAPHPDVDIFFYDDYWWSRRGDYWYRSGGYNGPWHKMDRRYIPDHVYGIPRNYRSSYKNEHRIPYGQWKKQWKHGNKMEYTERTDGKREYGKEDKREGKHGHGHGHGHK